MTQTSLALPDQRAAVTQKHRRLAGRILIYIPLIIWAIFTLYPFLWTFITSFRDQSELYNRPFALPTVLHWQNYIDAWTHGHVSIYALNSFVVVITSTFLALALAMTSAFVLGRFNFKLKGVLWAYVLFGMLVPQATMLVPLAILVRKLGLYDHLLGLALVYAAQGVPFNVFLLTSFIQTIPRELEEAAIMDGASMWQVFIWVITPLSKPAIATTATFHALYSWNEYLLAVIMIVTETNRTLPTGMKNILGEYRTNFPGYAAGMVIAFIPAVVFFILLQRYVERGISAGALQGM